MMEPGEKVRRLKFTISVRAIMVLVAVLGLAGGWVAELRSKARAIAALKSRGAQVYYDYQFAEGRFFPKPKPWAPPWLRRRLGDEYMQEINYVCIQNGFNVGPPFVDDDLVPLERLRGLQRLVIINASITDNGLAHLDNLTQLQSLTLDINRLEGSGLVHLHRMSRLRELSLPRSNISDAGLQFLEGLSNLNRVDLELSMVTDAGLIHLQGLRKLRHLDVRYTKVTNVGVSRLTAHLPNLSMSYTQKPVSNRPKARAASAP